MKVHRNEKIGDHPAQLVRDLLADATNSGGFYFDLVEEHLFKAWWRWTIEALIKDGKIDRRDRGQALRGWTRERKRGKIFGARLPRAPDLSAQTHNLIKSLLSLDLIREEERESDGHIVYQVTDKGHAIGMKTLLPRMSRTSAEDLLKTTLERVAQINSAPELLHYVTEVRVFGSYLTETDDLGDLDLAIKLERRQIDDEWVKACHDLADKSGKTLSFFRRLTYPETEVRRRIKSRSPRISLHETSELDANPQMGGRTVYTFVVPLRSDQP